jgi:hypothetical protein
VEIQPGETEDTPELETIWIDSCDALTDDGIWKNEEDTLWVLTGLYAQLLAERDPQRYFDPFPEPEEFVESFQWFLYEKLPEDDAYGLRDRMRYFYNFEELVSYREQFLENRN